MKRHSLLYLLLALPLVTAFAQTKVIKTNALKSNNFGIEYVLPKTVLAVEIEYTETKQTAGQYARYASRYLGLNENEVVSEDQTFFTLDKVTVLNKYLPDKEKSYLVEFKAKTTAPFVYLTEDGVICTINAEYTPPAPTQNENIRTNTNKESFFTPQSIFTEEYLHAGSTSKMAEVAAKNIYSIREGRQEIIMGEVENMPKDGEAMRIVLNSLDEQERLWTELFIGKQTTVKHKKVIHIEPYTELERDVLFRFSKFMGIVDKNDLSGSPVFINIFDLKTVAIEEPDPKKKAKEPQSLVYNVPGKARVEVYNGNQLVYRGEHDITQFGKTQVLADNIFEDKNKPVKIYFYPETGAVRQIIQ